MKRTSHQTARRLLAAQRQMTSLIDKEIISGGDDLVFCKTDWVPLYFDTGYAVRSDCGSITAYRAVTLREQVLWLVFHPEKTRGYHAQTTDPLDAIEEARQCWARRRQVRRNWPEVERAARDLISGRLSFDVTREDAKASPLCLLGIEGFMRGIGMGRMPGMSGRLAAMLMKVEPQLGFVIYEALQRQSLAADVETTEEEGVAPVQ